MRLLRAWPAGSRTLRAGEVGIAHSIKNGLACVDFRGGVTEWIALADLEVVSR